MKEIDKKDNKDNKVLGFYINTIQYGGAERIVAYLANLFFHVGYDVYVITSYVLEDEYRLEYGVHRVVLNQEVKEKGTIKKNVEWIKEIRTLCKRTNMDCLIGFLREGNFRAISATLGIRTKSIIYNCGQPNVMYNTIFGRLIKVFILPMADKAVFELDIEQEFFPKRMRKKSIVIPHGITEEFYNLDRSPKMNQLISVGRLDPIKNLPMLIHAVSMARDVMGNIDLKIYGRGPDLDRIERSIREFNACGYIHIMGTVESVIEALKEADIFVLTSDSEGLPTTLMEAMSMGVPCIATDCPIGGVRWLIEDGVSGELVPIGDAERLAQRIIGLLNNRDLLNEISQNAKKRAQSFHMQRIFEEWRIVVDEL